MSSPSSPLPPIVLQGLEHDRFQFAEGQSAPCFGNVSQQEAEGIYELVRGLAPQRTLEIGFCNGISGCAILQALQDNGQGHHTAIDPFQQKLANGVGKKVVAEAGLQERLTLLEDFPEHVASHLPEAVEFAFIDASHLFDLSVMDFVIAHKRLAVGGVMGFHDMWMPALQRLVAYILRNHPYSVVPVPRQPMPKLTSRERIVVKWAPALRKSGILKKLLSPRVLYPLPVPARGNMVFLRKDEEVERDWRAFSEF